MIRQSVCLILTVMLLLSGCSSNSIHPPTIESTVPATSEVAPQPTFMPVETVTDILPEAKAFAMDPAPPVPVIPRSMPSGTAAATSEDAVIDYSHTEDGYVMVCYPGSTDKRLKVLVKGPSTTYNYNLTPGDWTVFPLSDGNGSYQVGVYINIADTRYAVVLTADFSVQLKDEFAPFLRPNQYVDYSEASVTVLRAMEITRELEEPLDKVAAIYDYVITNLHYDTEKANSVQSGYLPNLDQILEAGTGICFDYAAIMTAMLRSQQIPCKLVVGYAGSVYHAWISVWTEESGWIDGAIFFDGHVWHRMDPTFASSAAGSQDTMDFIQSGNYTVKYLY